MAERHTHRRRGAACPLSVATLLSAGVLGTPSVVAAADSRPRPQPLAASSAAATNSPVAPVTSIVATPDRSIGQAAEQGAAAASAHGVTQSVAVVDRSTGALVADVGGGMVYHTESLTKLFTAAFYLGRPEGATDQDLTDELSRMIAMSDDGIQRSLWRSDIVSTVAARYGLTGSSDPTEANGGDWGSDRTTADDMVTYLLRVSQDPSVGPPVLSWMAATQPTGADGFDQDFGLFGLTGDGGVKQGWSDPDWQPRNVHSVGWTDRYFVAILQTSPTAGFDTMRATSTATAQLLTARMDGTPAPVSVSAAASEPAAESAIRPPASPDPDPTGSSPSTESAGDPDGTDALGELGRSLADALKQGLFKVFRFRSAGGRRATGRG